MTLQIGRKRPIKPAGFTLIELAIVASIILVLVAVSTPMFKGTYGGIRLRDSAYSISKIMQYAQQRAVMEERRYRVLFDFEKGAYRLLVGQEKDIGGEFTYGWETPAGRFNRHYYLPEGVTFKGEEGAVTFLPNGRCDKFSISVIGRQEGGFEIKTSGKVGDVTIYEIKNGS